MLPPSESAVKIWVRSMFPGGGQSVFSPEEDSAPHLTPTAGRPRQDPPLDGSILTEPDVITTKRKLECWRHVFTALGQEGAAEQPD